METSEIALDFLPQTFIIQIRADMSHLKYLLTFNTDHKTAVNEVIQRLDTRGLVVKESFDLQIAKATHTGYDCPHHGSTDCDCQILVMLVYGKSSSPITLVIHSMDSRTHISIVAPNAGEVGNILTEEIIETVMVPTKTSGKL